MEATRKINHSKNCLDHFIVQNILKYDLQVLEHQNSSDDFPVVLKREYNKNFTKKGDLRMSLFRIIQLKRNFMKKNWLM